MNSKLSLLLINNALSIAESNNIAPLSIVILDNRSTVAASVSEEGVGTLRYDIALGKASAALGMGFGTRQFHRLVSGGVLPEMFADCINGAAKGRFIPLPGGVLIMDTSKKVIGAMGISGSSSDQDEWVALKSIQQADLVGSP